MSLKALVLETIQVSDMYLVGHISPRANFKHADGLNVKISQMRNSLLQMLA